MRAGAERDIVNDYLKRAQGLSRGLGFLGVEEHSVDLSKCKTRAEETRKLFETIPDGAAIYILDERGKSLKSRHFSAQLARDRDDGYGTCVFLIGGADGFEPSEIPQNIRKISFGVQTWPHKLVRVMLAEQIYRALSILAGTPYHRD